VQQKSGGKLKFPLDCEIIISETDVISEDIFPPPVTSFKYNFPAAVFLIRTLYSSPSLCSVKDVFMIIEYSKVSN